MNYNYTDNKGNDGVVTVHIDNGNFVAYRVPIDTLVRLYKRAVEPFLKSVWEHSHESLNNLVRMK